MLSERTQAALALTLTLCGLLAASTCYGQSGTRQSGTRQPSTTQPSATPQAPAVSLPAHNPYAPASKAANPLPTACGGYCVVTLHQSQQWALGQQAHAVNYDGQTYYFRSGRESAIFSAAPEQYAPVLGGQCLVTFSLTGIRQPGQLTFGKVHHERLFFFASAEALLKFEQSPQLFAKRDLVKEGQCVTTLVESGAQTPGVPRTTMVFEGLRYRFVDQAAKRRFLANPIRYQASLGISAWPSQSAHAPPLSAKSTARPLRSGPRAAHHTQYKPMLSGYCLVTLIQEGRWQLGDDRYRFAHDGKLFRFASAEKRQAFVAAPDHYQIANRGRCVVSESDMELRVAGRIEHVAEADGKIYLFAGKPQKQRFLDHPENYQQIGEAPDRLASQKEASTAQTDNFRAPSATARR